MTILRALFPITCDITAQPLFVVMEKSPVISKARALGLARALKLITRAFLGFADPIDFTNVTDLEGDQAKSVIS